MKELATILNIDLCREGIYQREDLWIRVRVTDVDLIDTDTTSATYNPLGLVDLTGQTLIYTWKRNISDEDILLRKTSATPGEIDFETQTALPWTETSTRGEALIKIASADTDPTTEIAVGRFYWDLWLQRAVAPINRLLIKPTPWQLLNTLGPSDP